MTLEEAIKKVGRFAPCPHENYDPNLGDGKTWGKCEDCGTTFLVREHHRYKKSANEFDMAIAILAQPTQKKLEPVATLRDQLAMSARNEDLYLPEKLADCAEYLGITTDDYYAPVHYCQMIAKARYEFAAAMMKARETP